MELVLTPEAFLGAGMIFLLRVLDMTLDTLRVLVVMRGRKPIAWVLGFFQALIFVVAISSVLKDLSNPLLIIGYAAGFATGNVVGMWIEERLAIGHTHMSIVSSRLGSAIAHPLKSERVATVRCSGAPNR
jgi:uncharacterized protein YebE (UPF0316 family)